MVADVTRVAAGRRAASSSATALPILLALASAHMINDLVQSLLGAIYPLIKTGLALDYSQIGLITLVFQVTASLLQPLVGMYTDRKPEPFSLAVGMACSLCGLLLLASASSFGLVLIAAGIIGTGSSIFHPEASRIARLASGGRHGFAQSLFQVGGASGQAIGPLLAALVVVPLGQGSIAWFSLVAVIGIGLLVHVGRWYQPLIAANAKKAPTDSIFGPLSRAKVTASIVILLLLTFSKNFYISSITSYYTFYLIDRFGVSVQNSQLLLFVFMGAAALGTFLGGPIGDRFGRKLVIWISILGVLPFSIALPYANLPVTVLLSFVIGFVMSSAFSAIVVFAQELLPGRVGLVGGLFFGFAFGAGGIGAALLGLLADHTSIDYVYKVCGFLPVIGILTVLLPKSLSARR